MARINSRRLAAFMLLGFASSIPIALLGHVLSQKQPGFSLEHSPVIDIFFLPSGCGWVLATDGDTEYLFGTSDGGRQWERSQMAYPLSRLFFLDSKNGWGIANTVDGHELVETFDGGKSWRYVNKVRELSKDWTMITGFLLEDQETGWISATQASGIGVLLQIADRGERIAKVSSASGHFGFARAIFTSPDHRYFWSVGSDSILRSSDHGANWSEQFSFKMFPGRNKSTRFSGGRAFDNGKVFLIGENAGAVIYRSSDFGESWQLVGEFVGAREFIDITFWDEQHGCASGHSGFLFCTDDGGTSWKIKSNLPTTVHDPILIGEDIMRIVFIEDGRRGWCLTAGGTLYATENAGHFWRRITLFNGLKDPTTVRLIR
jgi:photosystem II stability/assembly factor-like uncharacterized protein